MDDLINRQFAIDNMARVIWGYPNEIYPQLNDFSMALELAKDGLMGVPSAQRKGRWEYNEKESRFVKCSECKHLFYAEWNFCPNCGADMRGDEDG